MYVCKTSQLLLYIYMRYTDLFVKAENRGSNSFMHLSGWYLMNFISRTYKVMVLNYEPLKASVTQLHGRCSLTSWDQIPQHVLPF